MRRTGHRDVDGGDVQADMKRTVRKHIPDGASTKICLICRIFKKKSIYLIYRGISILIFFLKEIFGKDIYYMLCNKILC